MCDLPWLPLPSAEDYDVAEEQEQVLALPDIPSTGDEILQQLIKTNACLKAKLREYTQSPLPAISPNFFVDETNRGGKITTELIYDMFVHRKRLLLPAQRASRGPEPPYGYHFAQGLGLTVSLQRRTWKHVDRHKLIDALSTLVLLIHYLCGVLLQHRRPDLVKVECIPEENTFPAAADLSRNDKYGEDLVRSHKSRTILNPEAFNAVHDMGQVTFAGCLTMKMEWLKRKLQQITQALQTLETGVFGAQELCSFSNRLLRAANREIKTETAPMPLWGMLYFGDLHHSITFLRPNWATLRTVSCEIERIEEVHHSHHTQAERYVCLYVNPSQAKMSEEFTSWCKDYRQRSLHCGKRKRKRSPNIC